MKIIKLYALVGDFAGDKDVARDVREKDLLPVLDGNEDIIIDFKGVTGATQSFIHALISEAMRKHGASVLDRIFFKNCNESVREIITIVTEYMQEST